VACAEVGHVEALDSHRQCVERKRLAQIVESIDALLPAPFGPELVLFESEPRIAFGELVDPPLLASPRVA
jgi:hypothetical protein